jgi:hypothetical protein
MANAAGLTAASSLNGTNICVFGRKINDLRACSHGSGTPGFRLPASA